MTGSLQIKNAKYYIVLNFYDATGKRKQKWISTGLPTKGNKKLAEKMLREHLLEYENQELLEKPQDKPQIDILFSDAVRQWLVASAIRVDEVTLQGYETLAKSHILPYFDQLQIKLVDVTRQVLQKYLDEKYRNGRKDGKGGLSPASIRRHKNILHQTLKEAVLDELIPANPCTHVRLPKAEWHEPNFYSADQLNTFLTAIKDEPTFALIKVSAIYGLRRSEVLGLKWDSIDFEANTLTIKHTVSKVTKTVEKDKTKNASSRRSFPLLPEIKTLLTKIKKQEEENRELFGKAYVENDYIFKKENGQLYRVEYISYKFSWLLKHYGFPHIRFHDLRHSCASMILAMDFNLKDVQEWLGHAGIQVTADIYAHLDVTRKKNMANKLAIQFPAN